MPAISFQGNPTPDHYTTRASIFQYGMGIFYYIWAFLWINKAFRWLFEYFYLPAASKNEIPTLLSRDKPVLSHDDLLSRQRQQIFFLYIPALAVSFTLLPADPGLKDESCR